MVNVPFRAVRDRLFKRKFRNRRTRAIIYNLDKMTAIVPIGFIIVYFYYNHHDTIIMIMIDVKFDTRRHTFNISNMGLINIENP